MNSMKREVSWVFRFALAGAVLAIIYGLLVIRWDSSQTYVGSILVGFIGMGIGGMFGAVVELILDQGR